MIQVLEAVAADQIQAGEVVQPPGSLDAIKLVRDNLRKAFDATLPPDVAAFLTKTNGLDYNGLVIYGCSQSPERPGPGGFWQGLIEANRLWRDGSVSAFLIIGETDMDLLTVDLTGRDATLRDKVSHDVNERFDTVSGMIETVLKRRL